MDLNRWVFLNAVVAMVLGLVIGAVGIAALVQAMDGLPVQPGGIGFP